MSASDAAPLPRLGEVFFDVRGSSRSMRLSWYSDTGVAVFSIWQGGTCTGTFRLPIDDLPRMVDALQRGPRGATPPLTEVGGTPGERPRRGIPGGGTDPAMPPVENYPDYATGQNISLSPATGEFRAPGPEDYGNAPYGGDPLGSGSYRQQPPYPERGQAPEPAFPPSYPDGGPSYADGGPGYPDEGPGYRDSGPPAPAGPPPGYRDDPLGGYRDEPPAYPGSDAPYGGDPLGSGSYRQPEPPAYREDPYQQQPYQDEPPMAYPNESRGQRYTDDPFQSVYPEDSRNGYGDDPRPGSHPYARERDGRDRDGRDRDGRDRDGREQRAPRGRS